ncbi:MAG: plasmid pRiA4b ORF-3 family protein [Desulfotomaculales bacterium]
MARKQPLELTIYQFKVALREVRPPVWRRLQVIGDITLHRLHLVLQAVMGWENHHLYEFVIGGLTFGEPDPDFGTSDWNSRTKKLWQVPPERGAKFLYRYDFGDNWEHDVVLEKVLPPEGGVRYPVCLGGARVCPPEDCGGVAGYERMPEALRDPRHEEYGEWLDWLGREFDPDAFNLDAVNRALGRHRKKAPGKGFARRGRRWRRKGSASRGCEINSSTTSSGSTWTPCGRRQRKIFPCSSAKWLGYWRLWNH